MKSEDLKPSKKMKTFNGKAIYSPKGKAGEYGKYACNFYVGCSNECTYCYLHKGIGKATLGGNKPTLKKCFKDEADALRVFEKELKQNLPELQEHGLFFSFTTDPMLKGYTRRLTDLAVNKCVENEVCVKILTKRADFVFNNDFPTHGAPGGNAYIDKFKRFVAFGFTLTGHDELEPNASTNAERIEAMRKLHDAGFKTWASIEPIIDVGRSFDMITAADFCNLYKIGILSGGKYDINELKLFVHDVINYCDMYYSIESKIYFKDSLLKAAGIRREDLPANCVTRDYNIFNNK